MGTPAYASTFFTNVLNYLGVHQPDGAASSSVSSKT